MIRVLLPILVLLYLLSPLAMMDVDPHDYQGGRSRSELDRARRNTSAVAQMLGDLRTGLSDIIFLKTERYMDNGIAYVPHLDAENMNLGVPSEEAEEVHNHEHDAVEHDDHEGHDHDDHDHGEEDHEGHDHDEHGDEMHEGHDHSGTPTIIPTAEEDFRGPIGWMHREIAPWQDPSKAHSHTPGTELLPWYRLMTMADPHSVRGYAIGAWWLRSENIEEGLLFLEEGIANNPEAFQLPLMHGRLLYQQAKLIVDEHAEEMGWEEAWERDDVLRLVMAAQRDFLKSVDLAIANIPPADATKEEREHWVVHDEEDSLAACSLAIGIEMRFGDPERGRAWAHEWFEVFGPLSGLNRYF